MANKSRLSDGELFENHYHFKRNRSDRNFYFILGLIVVIALGLRILLTMFYGGVYVDGLSMYPTLQTGDELIMKYGEKAERGDIIVVDVRKYNFPGTDFLIKRLIATEGDSVYCENKQVYIKYAGTDEFVPLDEPYINDEYYAFDLYEVGEGEVFFLGDNRANSRDSRYKEGLSQFKDKLYKETDIYGVVCEWSVKHKNIIKFLPSHGFRN